METISPLTASSSESDVMSLLIDDESTVTGDNFSPHTDSVGLPANTLEISDNLALPSDDDDMEDSEAISLSQQYPAVVYPTNASTTPIMHIGDRTEVNPAPILSGSSSKIESMEGWQDESKNEGGDEKRGCETEHVGSEQNTYGLNEMEDSFVQPGALGARSPSKEQDDAVENLLPPNYPPIIYPIIHSVLPEPELTPMMPEVDHMMVDPEPGPSGFSSKIESREEMEGPGDDDNEDGEDGDGSSEVSAGGDLLEDLESALGGDFDFKGNYYYSSTAPGAPNPCLNIEGLGSVGLPLSPRDAQSIIECSTQAPFGHRDRTVIDKEVRDTWEVEPARIKFDNPAWANFVQITAFNTVWHALGVAPFSTPPRCELYKLLLYETGSHFLSHQDTEKVDGMFATIIIVLPSPFTGGEIHLSHGSSSTILNIAPTSLLSTSILAWYTDVKHEVKPITSGYRLALSYNLIHTSPGVPPPVLPDTSRALLNLRNVLRKWRKGTYDGEPEKVAYLLDHQYSAANLQLGEKALKGKDLHQITNLKSLAAEFRFMVCLGTLSCHMIGDADEETGYGYQGSWKRGRYRYHDYGDDDDNATMGEVHETTFTISNLVDLDGNVILDSSQTLSLDEESLIPRDPFEDAEPDDKEYEGYMGNYAGSVEYWYRRTVLVILSEDNAPGILFAAGGITYALQKLKQSNSSPPTTDDIKMANLVIDRLSPTDTTTAITMANYALKWNNTDIWKTVTNKGGSLISTFGVDNIINAMKVFSFKNVRESFEDFLSKTTSLSERLNFIHAIPLQASPEEIDSVRVWVQDRAQLAFASFNKPTVEDIPALLAVARVRGAPFLRQEILPQLMKNPSVFNFCISFVKALQEHKKSILERSQSTPGEMGEDVTKDVEAFDHLLDQCLNTAVFQWEAVVAQPSAYPYHKNPSQSQQSKVSRVIDLIEVCLLTGRMAPCKNLFLLLLKVRGDASQKFETLYSPLVPRMRELLSTKNVDMFSPPFSDLLQLLVGTYLRDVLGASPRNIRTKVRKIGCGCGDCNMVDNFLSSSTSAQQLFRYAQIRRTHVERQLSSASDLVSFQTIRSGSPYGIQVTKRPEIVAALQWNTRVAHAHSFLRSFGDDDALSKLMGNRYGDVMKALQGSQQFILTVGDAATSVVAGSRPVAGASQAPPLLTANAASSSRSTVPGTSAPPSIPVAGKKRKKGLPISGPIIDLTGDDSS